MSNSREEGWLQLKVGEMGNWDRMYITFESGIFLYSPMIPETTGSDLDLFDSGTKFLMDQVISLRTDVRIAKMSRDENLDAPSAQHLCNLFHVF